MLRKDHAPTPTPYVGGRPSYDDVGVMASQELIREIATHQDAEVTVAVGAMLIDVTSVSYDVERDVFVLRMLPEDLADAVREFVASG